MTHVRRGATARRIRQQAVRARKLTQKDITATVDAWYEFCPGCAVCGRPVTRGGLCAGTEYQPGGCGRERTSYAN